MKELKMIYRAGEYVALAEKIARANLENNPRVSWQNRKKYNRMLDRETLSASRKARDIFAKAYKDFMDSHEEFYNEEKINGER